MNQAIEFGYNKSELKLLKKAFDFALRFANGIYRAQGIPLIEHLTRTASILIACQQSIHVVITGLLHAVFVIHKFDHSKRSSDISLRKKDLEESFGKELSRMVYQYEELDWYKANVLQGYVLNFEQLTDEKKSLLIIRLANELDDHLDMAMSFSSDSRIKRRSQSYGGDCVKLAEKLGLIQLAKQLEEILLQQQSQQLPEYLRSNAPQGYELQCRLWKRTWRETVKWQIKKILGKV